MERGVDGYYYWFKSPGSSTKVPKKKSTSKRQIVQIIKPLSGALLK